MSEFGGIKESVIPRIVEIIKVPHEEDKLAWMKDSKCPAWDILEKSFTSDPLSDLFFHGINCKTEQSGQFEMAHLYIIINHLKFEESCEAVHANECKNHLAMKALKHFGMEDFEKFSDFSLEKFQTYGSFSALLEKFQGLDGFRYNVIEAPNSDHF